MTDLMHDLPAPLIPPECNLRGLEFMPLQVAYLMDSDLFILSTGDEFKAAMALWCKAWHQIPGGSLPDDERLLAAYSGAKAWAKVKGMAMRGWVKCSDGRLYHPVVAANAIKAWEGRQDFQEEATNRNDRQARWREKLKALSAQLRAAGVQPPAGASLKELERLIAKHVDGKGDGNVDGSVDTTASTGDKSEMGSKGEGQGKRQGKGQGEGQTTFLSDEAGASSGAAAKHAKPAKAPPEPPPTNATWNAYAEAYTHRYGANPVRNAKVNGMLANLVGRLGAEEAPEVAAFFVTHQHRFYVSGGHTLDLLVRDAEKLRTEWFTGRQVTATQAQQADRTQTNGQAFAGMLAEARAREAAHG